MSHLLLLYVTLEQEAAIQALFVQHKWKIISTDLASIQSLQDVSAVPHNPATLEMGQASTMAKCSSNDMGTILSCKDKDSMKIEINGREGEYMEDGCLETLCDTEQDCSSTALGPLEQDGPTADSVEVDKELNGATSRVECKKVLSAYEIHRHLEPSCAQPMTCNNEYGVNKYTGTITGCPRKDSDSLYKGVDNSGHSSEESESTVDTSKAEGTNTDKAGTNIDKAGTHIDKAGTNIDKAGTNIDKAGTNICKAVSDESEQIDNKQKKAARKIIQMKIERGKKAFLEKKKRKQKVENGVAINGVNKSTEDKIDTIRSKRRGKKRPVYCHDCKTMFTSQKRYDGHKEKNGGQCVFECEYCGKVFFYRKSKYLLHLRSAHTKERPFVCDICNKAYVTSDKLKIHKRQHTGEKPCVCEQCGKSFYSRADLSIHIDYHHKAKENMEDFKCDQCNITFCSKRYLIYHKNVTHSNRRDFVCNKCDKRFKCNSALQRHIRQIHTENRNYKCTFCEKAFKTSSTLKKHLLRHGGEKEFYCSYCDKGFYEKTKLVQHTRTHTGEKPYKCDLCDYRCALSGNLSKHRKTHYKSL